MKVSDSGQVIKFEKFSHYVGNEFDQFSVRLEEKIPFPFFFFFFPFGQIILYYFGLSCMSAWNIYINMYICICSKTNGICR